MRKVIFSINSCESFVRNLEITMRKVFLGGLPKTVTDDALKEMFLKYGSIADHVVMKDSRTRQSRGFGFIEFDNEESVDRMFEDRPIVIDGREIEIRRAMPKNVSHTTIHEKTRRLFIGGLNHSVTEDDLRRYYDENFSKYGKVVEVEVKKDKVTNVPRGFAFVTFDNEDAVDAIILKDTRPTCFGRNCEVKKSEPVSGAGSKRGGSRRSPPRDRRRSRGDDRERRRSRSRERERMPMFRDYDYGRSPPGERYYQTYDYESYDYDRGYQPGPPPAYQHSYSTGRPPRPLPGRDSEVGRGYPEARSIETHHDSRYGPPRGADTGYRGGYYRPPY